MNMLQAGIIYGYKEDSPSETVAGNTSTFHTLTFPTPYPAGSTVVVIPMVQTFNGPHTPGIRISDVTETGFKCRINEVVTANGALSNGTHRREDIGWIAFTV